jgi:hypothetical protein
MTELLPPCRRRRCQRLETEVKMPPRALAVTGTHGVVSSRRTQPLRNSDSGAYG